MAVCAGTRVDTLYGEKILKLKGIETISIPISNSPEEQSLMQYYSKDKLEKIFIDKIAKAIEEGAEKVFLYCNSLSSAIDYEKISKLLKIKIITPLETYKNLPEDSKNIVILAANGISAYKIDRIVKEDLKKSRNTITVGNIQIVNMIEEGYSPETIFEKLNLTSFFKYLENIQGENKIDTLILGCTHFPYIKDEIIKNCKIRIIDPTEEMVESLYN
ncbi:MAG: aspartate/glutamate racemase family protein [Peptoniphilaceae bacterium]